ncbi:MAG: NAD-dependent malic enzyme [Byssovorax sp.]
MDVRTKLISGPSGRRVTGLDLLRDPALNKGTAFSQAERDTFGLNGLLPPRVHTIEEQVQRELLRVRRQPDDLARYVHLAGLRDRNETLFYRVVMDAMDEMMPLIYTPTVGEACQQYARIYQAARGVFVSANDRGRVASVLRAFPQREVGIIVVTDGERILGLGDLGANGMGIPVGKLSLYTACAGVHPMLALPIAVDVGTDNPALLDDPLYIGLRQKRVRGPAYDELIDELVTALGEVFPGAVIQFEDFANTNAFRLLDRYAERGPIFNDDIQGTAAVTLAGIYSALRVTRAPLADQRLLCLGAGEAAVGLCDLFTAALTREGMPVAEARKRCFLFDSKGLVVSSREGLTSHKKHYAQAMEPCANFAEAVRAIRPTALIGASGQPKTFTREVLEAMAAINERPIVFALSNPTSKSECTAEEAYAATNGKAIFASGSPFPRVLFEGRTFVPGQANNAYIFPGVGLGAIACGARRITDEMFSVAAHTLADQVSEDDLALGRIFPSLSRIKDVSLHIAAAVAEVAWERGLASKARPSDPMSAIRAQQYEPRYLDYVGEPTG